MEQVRVKGVGKPLALGAVVVRCLSLLFLVSLPTDGNFGLERRNYNRPGCSLRALSF